MHQALLRKQINDDSGHGPPSPEMIDRMLDALARAA